MWEGLRLIGEFLSLQLFEDFPTRHPVGGLNSASRPVAAQSVGSTEVLGIARVHRRQESARKPSEAIYLRIRRPEGVLNGSFLLGDHSIRSPISRVERANEAQATVIRQAKPAKPAHRVGSPYVDPKDD